MPESTFDALSQEIASFRETLATLQSVLAAVQHPEKSRSEIADRLDDLENIVLAVAAVSPQIGPKARKAFDNLKAALELNPAVSPATVPMLSNRLTSQAESIARRVDGLLHSNSDAAPGQTQAEGIIRAQEEERKRISRDIHDGPAQTLASLTMRIDYCLEQHSGDRALIGELQELKDSVIRSLKDIRRFIFDLRPMALDDLGLIPTLEQFISGFKARTGIPVYVEVEGERAKMSGEKELAVFRVIQEAANNAVKHAEPSSVHIFLNYDEARNRLAVVVKDDGSGFDVSEIRRKYGTLKKLGLISMEERVRFAGGELHIVSDSGTGTVVSFWVPI